MDIGAVAEECPICLEDRICASIRPCGHRMCPPCFHTVMRHHITCPVCRGSITGAEPTIVEVAHSGQTRQLQLTRYDVDEPLGVNVKMSDLVATVSWVEPDSFAAVMGFAVNDVLLSINGLPCYSVMLVKQLLRSSYVCVWIRRPSSEPSLPLRGRETQPPVAPSAFWHMYDRLVALLGNRTQRARPIRS